MAFLVPRLFSFSTSGPISRLALQPFHSYRLFQTSAQTHQDKKEIQVQPIKFDDVTDEKFPSNKLMAQFFDQAEVTDVGRSWRTSELRTHSFTDLHKLWFVLQKEKHLLKTSQHEAKRSQGEFAKKSRLIKVRKSMARLKFVVHERLLAYKKALEILEKEENPPKPKAPKRVVDNLEKIPSLIKIRMLKFRHHTWELNSSVPPVSVNGSKQLDK